MRQPSNVLVHISITYGILSDNSVGYVIARTASEAWRDVAIQPDPNKDSAGWIASSEVTSLRSVNPSSSQ